MGIDKQKMTNLALYGRLSIHPIMQPTVIIKDGIKRCSKCNLDLTDEDYRFISKHLHRCANKINPYIYSDRQRGRPTNKERARLLKEE